MSCSPALLALVGQEASAVVGEGNKRNRGYRRTASPTRPRARVGVARGKVDRPRCDRSTRFCGNEGRVLAV